MKPGTNVTVEGRAGVVKAVRPGNMVDVRFHGEDFDTRHGKAFVKPVLSNPGPRGGLTPSERESLPTGDFALPGRRFPINDANHGRIALQYVLAGRVAERDVDTVVQAVLHRWGRNREVMAFYNKHKAKLTRQNVERIHGRRMAANPAGEVYDPTKEQLRARTQGIYENAVRRHLGVHYLTPFKDARGQRLDASLDAETKRNLSHKAHAIATAVEQRDGNLIPGTRTPTAKGIQRSAERLLDPSQRKHAEENREDYELTLAGARKSSYFRVVTEIVDGQKRYTVQPRPPAGLVQIPAYRMSADKAQEDANRAEAAFRKSPQSVKGRANPYYFQDVGGYARNIDIEDEPAEGIVGEGIEVGRETYQSLADRLGVPVNILMWYGTVTLHADEDYGTDDAGKRVVIPAYTKTEYLVPTRREGSKIPRPGPRDVIPAHMRGGEVSKAELVNRFEARLRDKEGKWQSTETKVFATRAERDAAVKPIREAHQAEAAAMAAKLPKVTTAPQAPKVSTEVPRTWAGPVPRSADFDPYSSRLSAPPPKLTKEERRQRKIAEEAKKREQFAAKRKAGRTDIAEMSSEGEPYVPTLPRQEVDRIHALLSPGDAIVVKDGANGAHRVSVYISTFGQKPHREQVAAFLLHAVVSSSPSVEVGSPENLLAFVAEKRTKGKEEADLYADVYARLKEDVSGRQVRRQIVLSDRKSAQTTKYTVPQDVRAELEKLVQPGNVVFFEQGTKLDVIYVPQGTAVDTRRLFDFLSSKMLTPTVTLKKPGVPISGATLIIVPAKEGSSALEVARGVLARKTERLKNGGEGLKDVRSAAETLSDANVLKLDFPEGPQATAEQTQFLQRVIMFGRPAESLSGLTEAGRRVVGMQTLEPLSRRGAAGSPGSDIVSEDEKKKLFTSQLTAVKREYLAQNKKYAPELGPEAEELQKEARARVDKILQQKGVSLSGIDALAKQLAAIGQSNVLYTSLASRIGRSSPEAVKSPVPPKTGKVKQQINLDKMDRVYWDVAFVETPGDPSGAGVVQYQLYVKTNPISTVRRPLEAGLAKTSTTKRSARLKPSVGGEDYVGWDQKKTEELFAKLTEARSTGNVEEEVKIRAQLTKAGEAGRREKARSSLMDPDAGGGEYSSIKASQLVAPFTFASNMTAAEIEAAELADPLNFIPPDVIAVEPGTSWLQDAAYQRRMMRAFKKAKADPAAPSLSPLTFYTRFYTTNPMLAFYTIMLFNTPHLFTGFNLVLPVAPDERMKDTLSLIPIEGARSENNTSHSVLFSVYQALSEELKLQGQQVVQLLRGQYKKASETYFNLVGWIDAAGRVHEGLRSQLSKLTNDFRPVQRLPGSEESNKPLQETLTDLATVRTELYNVYHVDPMKLGSIGIMERIDAATTQEEIDLLTQFETFRELAEMTKARDKEGILVPLLEGTGKESAVSALVSLTWGKVRDSIKAEIEAAKRRG